MQFPEAADVFRRASRRSSFLYKDHGVDYVYFASPYPLVRVPADPDQLKTVGAYEAYTCLKAGTRVAQHEMDRDADGVLRYAWKPNTQARTAGSAEQADHSQSHQRRRRHC